MIPLHSKKSQSVFWLFFALTFNSIIAEGRREGRGICLRAGPGNAPLS